MERFLPGKELRLFTLLLARRDPNAHWKHYVTQSLAAALQAQPHSFVTSF